MSSFFPSSLVVKKVAPTTLADDKSHNVSNVDIPFYAADMQCQTAAVKIGVAGSMDFVLYPNETYWTYNANLKDFQVMNNVPTVDGQLIVIATVPNQFVEAALKQGFKAWG